MTRFPYFRQELPESCVPACLRSILAGYGVVISERELRECCETDEFGTLPSSAVRCAQSLDFDASSPRLTDLYELIAIVESAQTAVIVFVNLSVICGLNVIHSVVVEMIDPTNETIEVLNPAHEPLGYHQWPLSLFEVAWRMARNQAVLIARKQT